MIVRWRLWGWRGVFYPARALAEWFFVVASALVSVGYFNTFLFFVLCPSVSVLRHLGLKRPFRLPVNALWALLVLFALDSISVLVLFLYHAGWIYLLAWLALTALGGLLISRYPVAHLRPYHGVLVAMVVVLFVESTLLNQAPSAPAHAKSGRDRDLAIVFDQSQFLGLNLIPRFLASDSKDRALFVSYRLPFLYHYEDAKCDFSIIRANLGNGTARSIDLECGETIGMAYDPWTESIAAVLVYATKRDEPVQARLVLLDPDGNIRKEVPLPDVPWCAYYCSVLPAEGEIWLYADTPQMLVYERGLDRVSRRPTNLGQGFFLAHTNHVFAEGRFYASYGGSLLTLLLQPGIAAWDLSTMRVLKKSSRFLCGTYTLAYDPQRRELYTNSQWSGTLNVLDPNLNPVREVRIGGVVRSIALDVERRRGYALRYITGELFSFDLDSGQILGSTRICKGGRVLHVLRSGEILAGSGCGVVRVDPQVFSIPARQAEEEP